MIWWGICIAALFLTAGLVAAVFYIRKSQQVFRSVDPGAGNRFGIVPYDELNGLCSRMEQIQEERKWHSRDDRERELLESQMQFMQLQNQINPHFLYNTLENIRARAILDDNEVIADMTESLSRFFRYNISKRSDVVRLSEELDNIRTYIHIQQYRFSNRFNFQVFMHDGDPGVLDALIPKMTLQPIVENAIIHGMENKLEKGHIEIHIESDKDHVYVLVEDDGNGISKEDLDALQTSLSMPETPQDADRKDSHGIAMKNVNKRLKLLFGEACGMTISSTQGVGTEVELILPRVEKTENESK